MRQRDESGGRTNVAGGEAAGGRAPGKRTLTETLQRKVQRKAAAAPEAEEAGKAVDEGFAGQAQEVPHRASMEKAFGRSFADVQAHTGPEAKAASESIGAEAFTTGNRIAFRDANPDQKLVAHELTHVVQQSGGPGAVAPKGGSVSEPGDASEVEADRVADAVAAGGSAGEIAPLGGGADAPVARKPGEIPPGARGEGTGKTGAKDEFPWIGRISGTVHNAALRKTPRKDADDPHKNTLADIPSGTFMNVYAREGGWLKVQVTVDGKELEGWVSQELVVFHSPTDWDDVRHMPTFSESMVILKKAQTDKKNGVKIESKTQERIDKAVEIVKRNPKYKLDESTYEITFAKEAGKKVQVVSIEDFILFVEDVERQYSGAKPSEIATEVRQLWFSDANWDVLVDGDGVMDGGKPVDIETEPNPIAKQYDMKDLAPSSGGKKIATRLGTVDIGHVMAGIDAALNGGPAAYPKERLKRRGEDNGKSEFKYETLKEGSDGDPRPFTTWAGDLGQAYAIFISDKYIDGKDVELRDYVNEMAKPQEMLGDIHGYIAVQVWKSTPSKDDPTGGAFSVSAVLRDLYLLDNPGAGGGGDGTYRAMFEKVSGKAGEDLKNYIWIQAFSFAEPWFVKHVIDNDPTAVVDGYTELRREFNVQAGQHEDRNGNNGTLNGLVNDLLRQLDGKLDGSYK